MGVVDDIRQYVQTRTFKSITGNFTPVSCWIVFPDGKVIPLQTWPPERFHRHLVPLPPEDSYDFRVRLEVSEVPVEPLASALKLLASLQERALALRAPT